MICSRCSSQWNVDKIECKNCGLEQYDVFSYLTKYRAPVGKYIVHWDRYKVQSIIEFRNNGTTVKINHLLSFDINEDTIDKLLLLV